MGRGFKRDGKFHPTENKDNKVSGNTVLIRGESFRKKEVEDDLSGAVREILKVPNRVVRDTNVFGVAQGGNQLEAKIKITSIVGSDEIEKLKSKGIVTTQVGGSGSNVELFTKINVPKLREGFEPFKPSIKKKLTG